MHLFPRNHVRVPRPHALLLALLALAVLVPLVAVRPATAVPAGVPDGRWETFASGNDVLTLELDGNLLWAGTRAGGLVRWDLAGGEHVQYLRPQDPLGSNTIRDIVVGADGDLWLATDQGLTWFDDGGTPERSDDRWRTYTRDNTVGGLPSDDVRAVAADGDRVWVGAAQVWDPDEEAWQGGGLGRLDTAGTEATADDTWAPVATFDGTIREAPDKITLGLVSDNIAGLLLTDDGDLWVATGPHWRFEQPPVAELPPRWTRVHGGISHLDTGGTAEVADDVWTATDCEDMQVTVTCHVQAMAMDRDGYVWAAIGGRGVMYFPADEPSVIDERSRRFDLPEGASDDFVEAIAFGPAGDPDLANTVWMARRKGGVSVLDHNGTRRQRTDDIWNFDRGTPFTVSDGLARDRVQALAVGDDMAYAGTGPLYGVAGGVSPIDFTDLKADAPLVTDVAPVTNFITRLAFGEPGSRWENHVWIGTGSRVQQRFGTGVLDLDTRGTNSRDDDRWSHHTMFGTDADGRPPWTGLAGDNVQALALQGDRVWIGSAETLWDHSAREFTDGGLSVFDGVDWTARNVENTGGADAGLRHGSVSDLAVGCADELWVGTGDGWGFWGSGLDVLTPGGSVHVLGQDSWAGHNWPSLASNNTTDIAVDCDRRKVWAAAEHHVTRGDPERMQAGGLHVGGGVAVYDLDTEAWTRYDSEDGLECYDQSFVDCEATTVTVSPIGDVWVGTYGTRAMDVAALVTQHPFTPAIVNTLPDGIPDWLHEELAGAGQVSGLTVDADGRLWVGTTRGGTARESSRPENWRVDRVRGGLMVYDGGTWTQLDTTSSGIPTNDISDVAIAPSGDVWIASEGWGLARYQVGVEAATPTPTSDAPTPTPSSTATRRATGTATPVEPTPTGRATGTATPRRTQTPGGPDGGRLHLPLIIQTVKR